MEVGIDYGVRKHSGDPPTDANREAPLPSSKAQAQHHPHLSDNLEDSKTEHG
jgi:hypothetical protein